MKEQLTDMNELKRKINALSKLPSEGEFNNLKSRIDIIENSSNVLRKKIEEQEKKIQLLQEVKFAGK
jgi:predicted  nucleic acid-binding Zn-ribbon protein